MWSTRSFLAVLATLVAISPATAQYGGFVRSCEDISLTWDNVWYLAGTCGKYISYLKLGDCIVNRDGHLAWQAGSVLLICHIRSVPLMRAFTPIRLSFKPVPLSLPIIPTSPTTMDCYHSVEEDSEEPAPTVASGHVILPMDVSCSASVAREGPTLISVGNWSIFETLC